MKLPRRDSPQWGLLFWSLAALLLLADRLI